MPGEDLRLVNVNLVGGDNVHMYIHTYVWLYLNNVIHICTYVGKHS